jgi:type II secretory ATPase GspE/PulE/Tfp pilus assembly ATPase PilB-like protein
LGSKPYFLANCLLGVISQRLVRTLCPHCRIRYDMSDSPETFAEISHLLGPDQGQAIFGPGKCDACGHSGYASRSGIFEVMTMSHDLRRLISDGASATKLQEAGAAGGMTEFRHSALLKVAAGETSTEEVMRALPTEFLGLEE